jgi:hypothetical protein
LSKPEQEIVHCNLEINNEFIWTFVVTRIQSEHECLKTWYSILNIRTLDEGQCIVNKSKRKKLKISTSFIERFLFVISFRAIRKKMAIVRIRWTDTHV